MGTLTPLHHRDDPAGPDPLLRDLLGAELRAERLQQGRTLDDVARRAGIATQYLSEVERGRKDPSSEVLAAVTGALDLPLLDLTVRAARTLHSRTVAAFTGPVALAA
ncbi:hypothetical protein GCM10028820_14810 [Tessaracoccus terricola]